MAEHGQESVSGLVDLGRAARHRLGKRLVDALAEPGEVFNVFGLPDAFGAPETEDRCAQSAKLGYHLDQIEAGQVANCAVRRCGCDVPIGGICQAAGLAVALGFGLRTPAWRGVALLDCCESVSFVVW